MTHEEPNKRGLSVVQGATQPGDSNGDRPFALHGQCGTFSVEVGETHLNWLRPAAPSCSTGGRCSTSGFAPVPSAPGERTFRRPTGRLCRQRLQVEPGKLRPCGPIDGACWEPIWEPSAVLYALGSTVSPKAMPRERFAAPGRLMSCLRGRQPLRANAHLASQSPLGRVLGHGHVAKVLGGRPNLECDRE